MTADEKLLRQLLDALPIYATRIGYRAEDHPLGASTPDEKRFGDALFDLNERWLDVKKRLEEGTFR